MKKFYILVTLIFWTLGFTALNAQNIDPNLGEETTMSAKEARKAARVAHRAAVNAQNEALFQQAEQALKEQSWLVEVDQIVFPRGMTKFVTSLTNFVYMNNGNAVVQLALTHFNPGQNGLGGFTVQGKPSNITMSTAKNGTVYYNFNIQGVAISATINIQLIQGGNRATVTIYPNFNNNNITLTGNLVPYEMSDIFQGQTL